MSDSGLPEYIILDDGGHVVILRHYTGDDTYYKYLTCRAVSDAEHTIKALKAYE